MGQKDVPENSEPQIVVIVGPTAVGKTAMVLHLAARLPVEVISCDSMQVYRYLDIGTAKPSLEEQRAVPHHLIDVVDPDEDFDAGRYRQMAAAAIANVVRRGRIPLIVGGTGLYLRALLHGLIPRAPQDPEVRARLRRLAAKHGGAFLHQRLQAVDPQAAAKIHPHDLVRLIRGLEIWETTGRPPSQLYGEHGFRRRHYRVLKIGLQRPRSELYQRIERRVEEMMAQGLLEEVEELLRRGYGPELKSMQGLGYRHMVQCLHGSWSLEVAVEKLQRDTRRYAKRQMTWFRSDSGIRWFAPGDAETTAALIEEFFACGQPPST